MPIQTLTNPLYRIDELSVDRDAKGYFINMVLGHCDAAVLCISQTGPMSREELQLSEEDLSYLASGGRLDRSEKRCCLQGITCQQLAGAGLIRNFAVAPPAFLQAWGMKRIDFDINLYIPEDITEQLVQVPQVYKVQLSGSQMVVGIDRIDGYHDGDLCYSIDGHPAIPLPASWLNRPIPLRPGAVPEVRPAQRVRGCYKQG